MKANQFDQFGHNWWNTQDGEFKLLHAINPLRMQFILESIYSHFGVNSVSGLKVLDIGCGGGLVSIPMARLGADITGIDSSFQAIDKASFKATRENLVNTHYICTLFEEFETPEKFDVVLCMDAAEHVDSLTDLVSMMVRCLKPNGLIIISSINKTFKSLVQAIIMAEYVLRLLPRGTHEYQKLVRPYDLELEFNKHAFGIKQMKGIKYSILSRSWELSSDTDVNYMVAIASDKK